MLDRFQNPKSRTVIARKQLQTETYHCNEKYERIKNLRYIHCNVIYYAMLLLNETDPKPWFFAQFSSQCFMCSVYKPHTFSFMYNFSAIVSKLMAARDKEPCSADSKTIQNKYIINNQSACHITHTYNWVNCDSHMSRSKSNHHRSVRINQSHGHTGIGDIVWYWVK